MKSEDEIKNKFWGMYGKELKKRKDHYTSKIPFNCKYNRRKNMGGKREAFCINEEKLKELGCEVFRCEDYKYCQGCELFECKNSEKEIEESFSEVLFDIQKCYKEYPKLALLLWILEGDIEKSEEDKKSWWQRLLKR